MIDCKVCGTKHDGWDMVACRKGRLLTRGSIAPVLTTKPVPALLTQPTAKAPKVKMDRHKPGYMAAYMRKRREK